MVVDEAITDAVEAVELGTLVFVTDPKPPKPVPSFKPELLVDVDDADDVPKLPKDTEADEDEATAVVAPSPNFN